MPAPALLFVGSALTTLWGVSHLLPTRSVVAGFGDITPDNRNIITMEWIVEGVALVSLGILVLTVTLVDAASPVSRAVYIVSAGTLLALALVSLLTGFKVGYLPFKLCPVIFTASALLILFGGAI
jgi:hypothetical protein